MLLPWRRTSSNTLSSDTPMSSSPPGNKLRDLLSAAAEQLPPGFLHPLDDETFLYELLSDQLSKSDRSRLEQHLLNCDECRQQILLLCELEGLQYSLPAAPNESPGTTQAADIISRSSKLSFAAWIRKNRIALTAAAGVVIAVGVGIRFMTNGPDIRSGGATISKNSPLTPVVSRFTSLALLRDFGFSCLGQGKDTPSVEQLEQSKARVTDLRKQAADSPADVGIQLNLAAELMLAGENFEAEDCIRKALSLQPANPQILNALGIAQTARKDFDGALESFREASQASELAVSAGINAADVLIRNEKLPEARTSLQRLLQRPELSESDKQTIQDMLDYVNRP
jgi:tetratricopeptide (TPR) repeat protein